MNSSLLEAPTNASPQTSITLSQDAPSFFKSQSSWLSSLPYPLSLFINTESQEKWQTYENVFLACLRTGDVEAAYKSLEALRKRFGNINDRVIALQGLYSEAVAENDKDLEEVLAHYDELLHDDPTIFTLHKRRAALLRSMGRNNEAINALTSLLDASPTDAETWSELADLYTTLGSLDQAIYCLEGVLLVTPNAWNMHAKLGETLYLSSRRNENGSGEQLKTLSESMRRFCRSIELCDDYLRGYYGLKSTTTQLLETLSRSKKSQSSSADATTGDLAPPSIKSAKQLNELATSKLAEIVRKATSGEKGWEGYNEAELAAARALLDKDTQRIDR